MLSKQSNGKDRAAASEWIKESTNDQIREHLLTEVNSMPYQLEFTKTTSPKEKVNLRILSTKNTTEETDDFLFKNTVNEMSFENIMRNSKKMNVEEEQVELIKNLNLQQNGNSNETLPQKMPPKNLDSSSNSTIDRIQPNDLMEDSLNTCSLNKTPLK